MQKLGDFLLKDYELLSTLNNEPLYILLVLKMLKENQTMFCYSLLLKPKYLPKIYSEENLITKSELIETLKILKKIKFVKKEGDFVVLNSFVKSSILEGISYLKYEKMMEIEKELEFETSYSCYEFILKSLVEKNSNVSNFLNQIFVNLEIISSTREITFKGFEFLLKSRKEQLWSMIFESINILSDNDSANKSKLLILLAEIVLIGKNKIVKINETDNSEQIFLNFLKSLGIIEIDNKIKILPFIEALTEDKLNLADKFLIFETNYMLYAYTKNKTVISILNLFCKQINTFPNLTIFTINEESAKKAFDFGVTAKQIIDFLEMRVKSENLDKSVKEQIQIWEDKNNRIVEKDCFVYKDFDNLSEFFKLKEFIAEKKALIYSNESKRLIVGEVFVHEDVKNFIKNVLR